MSKTKTPKMDKAIVIALIGIAVTLFASPIQKVWLQETPTPEPGDSSSDEYQLIFENDFEDGRSVVLHLAETSGV